MSSVLLYFVLTDIHALENASENLMIRKSEKISWGSFPAIENRHLRKSSTPKGLAWLILQPCGISILVKCTLRDCVLCLKCYKYNSLFCCSMPVVPTTDYFALGPIQ